MGDIKAIVQEVFDEFDKDKSGFLEASEVEAILKGVFQHPECPAEVKAQFDSPAKIKAAGERFMKEVDTSGDKKISFDEFFNFIAG